MALSLLDMMLCSLATWVKCTTVHFPAHFSYNVVCINIYLDGKDGYYFFLR